MCCIAAVFVFLWLVSGQKTLGQVEWTIEDKVSSFGQNLTLFCAVDGCCSTFSGWVLWNYDSRDYKTIVIDLRGFKNSKYSGDLRKNGFTLVLKHLTETDMNRNYSCTYGSIVGEKKLLVKEEAFKTRTMASKSTILTNKAIIGIVVAACVVVILVTSAFCLWKRMKNGHRPDDVYFSIEKTEKDLISNDQLRVVVTPPTSTVLNGNTQIVTCFINGQYQEESVTWYFSPRHGRRKTINGDTNPMKYIVSTMACPSLTILNFQPSDSGSYTCSVANSNYTKESEPSLLTYINILSLGENDDIAHAILGNSLTKSITYILPLGQTIKFNFTQTINESKTDISTEINTAKDSDETILDLPSSILILYACPATHAADSSVLTYMNNCPKLKDSVLSDIAIRHGDKWSQVQISLEITSKELEQIAEIDDNDESVTQTTAAMIMWRNRKSNSPEDDNINETINALTSGPEK